MPEKEQLIRIYVMGKPYRVPKGLTILRALEYCGYKLIRGSGCRAGFCGACATVFNLQSDSRLQFALACQKTVEADMYLTQIPFFPARKASYDLEKLQADSDAVYALYPDMVKCFGCNACTKSCPQEIEVMSYMSDAIRGDIPSVAEKSFDCVMCGLCAARCPQGLVPYNIALLSRRLNGKYNAAESAHLSRRIKEIESGEFDAEIDKLKDLDEDQLKKVYEGRDIEAAY
jgi:ferredoxin